MVSPIALLRLRHAPPATVFHASFPDSRVHRLSVPAAQTYDEAASGSGIGMTHARQKGQPIKYRMLR